MAFEPDNRAVSNPELPHDRIVDDDLLGARGAPMLKDVVGRTSERRSSQTKPAR